MVRSRSIALYLMTTQRNLGGGNPRKNATPKRRERLTVPQRRGQRQTTPAWSPRAQVERRPMRLMRYARDLW